MGKSKAQLDREIKEWLADNAKRDADADADVVIVWYAVPNANKKRGGWMPLIENNAKVRGSTYGRGYDKEDAERAAKEMAEEEAQRYVGDWSVVVRKGRP